MVGLIPAHAGKTANCAVLRAANGAHPRSRGENFLLWLVGWLPMGSSPLTRGKQAHQASHSSGIGLIPAHAGKTESCAPLDDPIWAHPRSRGENSDTVTKSRGCRGSSPLTRGKPIERFQDVFQDGLIPAHAGKTHGRQAGAGARWAHPRSRGENKATDPITGDLEGSSPLTRGKRRHRRPQPVCGGLIPAHAGKTSSAISAWPSAPAHPRSRGENSNASRA